MHIRDVIPFPVLSFISCVGSTTLATALVWTMFGSCVFGGCIDTPLPEREPQARLITSWDPLACGAPHRVVIELEDDDGRMLSASVPCELAGVSIDVPTWGIYAGRIYAWSIAGSEATISSVAPVRLEIDNAIVEWHVDTPR
jgi:hypothetical protein